MSAFSTKSDDINLKMRYYSMCGLPLFQNDYEYWLPGQPDPDQSKKAEDCTSMVKKKQDKWNDASCDSQYAYVCKKLGSLISSITKETT